MSSVRRFFGSVALFSGLAYAGCGHASTLPPLGQVLLYLDTDAPVPAGPGKTLGKDEPAALFDTLSVEVFEPGATTPCAGCTREFAVDRDKLMAGLSFGVPSRAGVAGYRVRARLYQAAWLTHCPLDGTSAAADAAPRPRKEVTLEVNATLPAVPAEGIVERSVFFGVDTLGVPQGTLDAPVETAEGRPEASRVGTWVGARRVPCKGAPHADEVCVPGGAYWMGHPRLRTDCGTAVTSAFLVPKLVVISPFFLMKKEVTVGEYRASGLTTADIVRFSGNYRFTGDGGRPNARCTFTDAPAAHEANPVNCIPWSTADAYCKKLGAVLPAEAQWEFVAGAFASRYRPWGNDEPGCDDAVFGRPNGAPSLAGAPCSAKFLDEAGPTAVDPADPTAHRRLDHVDVATGIIVDLMGGVMEFQADTYSPPTDPCWSGAGILVDPVCTSGGIANMRSARGSSWQWPPGVAAGRNAISLGEWFTSTGFRCARPDS